MASAQLRRPVPGQILGIKKTRRGEPLKPSITSFEPPSAYDTHLGDLVRFYRDAQQSPLPHFTKTAEPYLGTKPRTAEAPGALDPRSRSNALRAWESKYYSRGDSVDDAIRLLFDTSNPLTSEFFSVAETIWGPLMDHRQKK